MEAARAWSLIAVGDDRQYAGNEGYSDEPSVYKYDSTVANHKSVKVGDLAVVRDRSKVIGIARIERIDSRVRIPVDRDRAFRFNVTGDSEFA